MDQEIDDKRQSGNETKPWPPTIFRFIENRAEDPRLSPAQRKAAVAILSVLEYALNRPDDEDWKKIIKAADVLIELDSKAKRVALALNMVRAGGEADIMTPLQAEICTDDEKAEFLIYSLAENVDFAFDSLTVDCVRRIINRADIEPRNRNGGNGKPGAWSVLARLALASGALGESRIEGMPSHQQVESAVARLKNAGKHT